MSRSVTVGLDESRDSLSAAEWAAGEALSRALPLRLVHVWNIDATAVTRLVDPDTQRKWADNLLSSVAERLRRGHPDLQVAREHIAGEPVADLCAVGDRSELLVLGSRHIGTLTGFVAGSVSLAVLGRSRRPVVLVRADSPHKPQVSPPSGDVVLGLDLFDPNSDLLQFAFACADRYGCGLRVLHTWSLPPVLGPDVAGAVTKELTDLANERNKTLDTVLAPWTGTYPAVPVSRQVRQGRPALDLVESSRDARLVVVGRRNREARLGAHVGAVTHAVVHHSVAPVAVVPHD
ncbi:universal stress protein [Streptomyces albidochromogenes]|uniref:universal stress protein n=1 Tax=Streptomyces albidochromogenes TaxID=329524 RepID=UPI00110FD291|nr:universal stress protein [Streptomyces albidochromogenes]